MRERIPADEATGKTVRVTAGGPGPRPTAALFRLVKRGTALDGVVDADDYAIDSRAEIEHDETVTEFTYRWDHDDPTTPGSYTGAFYVRYADGTTAWHPTPDPGIAVTLTP